MTEVLFTGPPDWGQKAYHGDAGIDLPITESTVLAPGEFADLPSGIRIAVPEGYYGRIVARSSALRKRRVRVYEGIIDSGFRGELFTYVENIGPMATRLEPGDRLAQLIIQPVVDVPFVLRPELPDSERGEKGFGSSDAAAPQWDRAPYIEAMPIEPTPLRGMLYLGGPIDHSHSEWWSNTGLYQRVREHVPGWVMYDPKQENLGERDPSVIWERNMAALLRADIALFVFLDGAGTYGFGSPIEIATRCIEAPSKRTIVYVEGHSPGVYLRKLWQDQRLIITDNWKDTLTELDEEVAQIV